MSKSLKIASAQINPIVGDIGGNIGLAEEALRKAKVCGRGHFGFARAIRYRLSARRPGA